VRLAAARKKRESLHIPKTFAWELIPQRSDPARAKPNQDQHAISRRPDGRLTSQRLSINAYEEHLFSTTGSSNDSAMDQYVALKFVIQIDSRISNGVPSLKPNPSTTPLKCDIRKLAERKQSRKYHKMILLRSTVTVCAAENIIFCDTSRGLERRCKLMFLH